MIDFRQNALPGGAGHWSCKNIAKKLRNVNIRVRFFSSNSYFKKNRLAIPEKGDTISPVKSSGFKMGAFQIFSLEVSVSEWYLSFYTNARLTRPQCTVEPPAKRLFISVNPIADAVNHICHDGDKKPAKRIFSLPFVEKRDGKTFFGNVR